MDARYKQEKRTIRKDAILDGLLVFLTRNSDRPLSVGELAASLDISKGNLYHYFSSIDEAFEQLVEREYDKAIAAVKTALTEAENASATQKLAMIVSSYYAATPSDRSLDAFLHLDAYAHIHQKSLVYLTRQLSAIFAEVICDGVARREFACDHPHAVAATTVGAFTFLTDRYLFSDKERRMCAQEIAYILELRLGLPVGALAQQIGLVIG